MESPAVKFTPERAGWLLLPFSDTQLNVNAPLATSGPLLGEISSDLADFALVKDVNVGTGLIVDEFRFGTELLDVGAFVVPVPEPTSLALCSLLGLAIFGRRRAKAGR